MKSAAVDVEDVVEQVGQAELVQHPLGVAGVGRW